MFEFVDSFYEPNPVVPVKELSINPAIDTIVHEIETEQWYSQQLTILVIGASGDLAKKKTYPALFELWKNQLLPVKNNQTIIHGFARHDDTVPAFRERLRPYLLKQLDDDDKTDNNNNGEQLVDDFLSICYYKNGSSYSDWESMRTILIESSTTLSSQPIYNLLVYMAIPPNIFAEACQSIRMVLKHNNDNNDSSTSINVPGFHRIVLEKPFGKDSVTCQELLSTLKDQEWDENTLYRIDHYLGKEIVQSIPLFRKNNTVWLSKLWDKNTIKSVHLVFKEPFGTDGRGGYFDPFGIIRDILQNHLLQVLTLIAMELPTVWTSNSIRDAKVNVLQHIKPVTIANALLGQYNGYRDDPSISNKETTTPTYACMKLNIDTPRWDGVPFILEAGKALDEQLCTVRIHFHDEDNNVTGTTKTGSDSTNTSNSLVFRLQPHPSVYFTANMKTPGFSDTTVSTIMGVDYEHCTIPEAYTKLVLDVLRGKQSNFVRDDELIAAWNIFTPLLHETEDPNGNIPPPVSYEQGTDGPKERQKFLCSMGIGCVALPTPCAL